MYYNDSDKMALFKIRLSDYFGGDVNEVLWMFPVFSGMESIL